MAALLNRAKMTTATTGTGTVTLGSASTGYLSLAEAGAVDATSYAYLLEDGDDFEFGNGTYTSSGTTFSRDTVTASKISGTAGTTKLTLSGTATLSIVPKVADLVKAVDLGTNVATRLAIANGIRESLTGNRTYYVRTDGSDSNTGLANTSGGAFLTVQKAIDVAAALDLSIYNVTIQVGTGTYTGAVVLKSYIGTGPISLLGDTTTPANVLLSTSGDTITADGVLGTYTLGGFKIASSAGIGLNISNNSIVKQTGLMDWGACSIAHKAISANAVLVVTANENLTGTTSYHYYMLTGGILVLTSGTGTVTGTPAYAGAFLLATLGAIVSRGTYSYSGSATGKRYDVTGNASISTNGGGTSFFPGGTAGTVGSGGLYDTTPEYGSTTIASGSLPAAATLAITDIPQHFSSLILKVTGWSQGTNTAQLRVRASTNNGSSYDSTAGNYVGNKITGTTVTNYTTNALASLIDAATQTTAQTGDVTLNIFGYNTAAHKQISARVIANTTEYQDIATYIGSTSAINALELSTSAAGSFDAGTYALYGVL